MTLAFPRSLSLFVLVFLASVVRAENDSSPVRDDAKLFHAGSVNVAEQRIADIRAAYDRNLFVRTVASISTENRRLLPFLRTPKVNRLLNEQARKFAEESGVRGIYVVICNRPRDVRVIVWPGYDPQFTRHDAEALRRMVVSRLDENKPDAALLALAEQVDTLLQTRAAPGSSWLANDFVFAGVLSGGLALWALLVAIRFRMRAGQPTNSTTEEGSLTARTTTTLLGAMFGSPAALWMYDKLYPGQAGTQLMFSEPKQATTLIREHESMEGADGQQSHAKDTSVTT